MFWVTMASALPQIALASDQVRRRECHGFRERLLHFSQSMVTLRRRESNFGNQTVAGLFENEFAPQWTVEGRLFGEPQQRVAETHGNQHAGVEYSSIFTAVG